MKSHDHKSTADDGKAKTRPGIKTSPQVKHPILQLQQMVGNKAVANMIQRKKVIDDEVEITGQLTAKNILGDWIWVKNMLANGSVTANKFEKVGGEPD